MSAAMQLKAAAALDNDNELLLGMIEGETDALELMDRLAEQALADKALVEIGSARLKRIEQRADRIRDLLLRMLEALELPKIERALYSASISHRRNVVVTDADALPEEFVRRAPDKVALGKALRAGQELDGAMLSNPQPSLVLTSR